MPTFINPHRFSECWQASREWPGTMQQQRAVRTAFALTFGSPFHLLMKVLDQSVNSVYHRSYLVVTFTPEDQWGSRDTLATAGITGINVRAGINMDVLVDLLRHEFGHVIDQHLMTQEAKAAFMEGSQDQNWTHHAERFADAIRDAIKGIGPWPLLKEPAHAAS